MFTRSMAARRGYSANGVRFDGTNDALERGDYDGNADGKLGILSFWYQFQGSDGTEQYVISVADNNCNVRKMGAGGPVNVWQVHLGDSGGVQQISYQSTTTHIADNTWHHFLTSWDTDDPTDSTYLYIDGSGGIKNQSVSISGSDLGYEGSQRIGVERTAPSLGSPLNAEIADLYFNVAVTMDFSSSSNREKFRDSDGKPVSLGSDGSIPTGTAPLVYLGNPAATFQVNLGSGGSLNVEGALTDAADSPSD